MNKTIKITPAQYALIDGLGSVPMRGVLTADVVTAISSLAEHAPEVAALMNKAATTAATAGCERTYAVLESTVGPKDGKRIEHHVVIADVPTLQAVQAYEYGEGKSNDGLIYLVKAVRTRFLDKVVGSVRNAADKLDEINYPVSVQDFIFPRKSDGFGVSPYKPFNDIADATIAQLAQISNGQIKLTKKKFRECLENAAQAKAYYPNVPQSLWEQNILAAWIKKYAENDEAVALFQGWLDSRNDAGTKLDLTGVDLGSLAV